MLSWNVLAESLLRDNRYLYRRCHPGALHAERHHHVIRAIHSLGPDVIMLQEVEMYDAAFRPALESLGYTGLYQRRTGGHTLRA